MAIELLWLLKWMGGYTCLFALMAIANQLRGKAFGFDGILLMPNKDGSLLLKKNRKTEFGCEGLPARQAVHAHLHHIGFSNRRLSKWS